MTKLLSDSHRKMKYRVKKWKYKAIQIGEQIMNKKEQTMTAWNFFLGSVRRISWCWNWRRKKDDKTGTDQMKHRNCLLSDMWTADFCNQYLPLSNGFPSMLISSKNICIRHYITGVLMKWNLSNWLSFYDFFFLLLENCQLPQANNYKKRETHNRNSVRTN